MNRGGESTRWELVHLSDNAVKVATDLSRMIFNDTSAFILIQPRDTHMDSSIVLRGSLKRDSQFNAELNARVKMYRNVQCN